ncbi:MAG TPA: hypothetical protein PL042_06635, partial [Caldisericia bacterium]|nr:hypothetical protein [Caldisericia bacterium]
PEPVAEKDSTMYKITLLLPSIIISPLPFISNLSKIIETVPSLAVIFKESFPDRTTLLYLPL